MSPTLIKENTFNPLVTHTNQLPEFFKMRDDGTYLVKKGVHEVNQVISLENNLTIEAGAQLKFAENSALIVQGSVTFVGTPDEPIMMSSKHAQPWNGVYIWGKGQKSKISNLIVENTQATRVGILNLTGGFTFYDGDIVINNFYLRDTVAEDALNIVNAKIDVNGLSIQGTTSDAFDCDFCFGSIRNSEISYSNGDGLDFSGSQVSVNCLHDKY